MLHFVFSFEGIPFVDFLVKQEGFDPLPPSFAHQFEKDIALLKKWCETTLLPQRVAAYKASQDPRKRFHIRKLSLALTLIASVTGNIVQIHRTLSLTGDGTPIKRIREEYYVLPKGTPIPKTYIPLYQREDYHERRTPKPHAKRLPIFRKSRPAR